MMEMMIAEKIVKIIEVMLVNVITVMMAKVKIVFGKGESNKKK